MQKQRQVFAGGEDDCVLRSAVMGIEREPTVWNSSRSVSRVRIEQTARFCRRLGTSTAKEKRNEWFDAGCIECVWRTVVCFDGEIE